MSSNRLHTFSFVLCILFLSGCAAPEKLVSKMTLPDEPTNLSGQWRLNEREGKDQAAVFAAINASDKHREVSRFEEVTGTRYGPQYHPSGRSGDAWIIGNAGGALVHVFLNLADKLKITQTESALFISFNRSIVSEYTFGENRMISVGEIVAARASGWSGTTYVIESLDEDRRKLTEKYSLSSDQQKLYRKIILRDEKMQEVSVAQVYDRLTK